MANGATQNPSNKVGRNSGAGPTGISALQPSPAEEARGLEPIGQKSGGWAAKVGMGFGVLALVGSGSAYLWKRVRQPKGFRARVSRLIRR